MPVLTGQTSDVAQGLYHLDTRHRKKESDLYLKVRAGGEPLSSREGDRPPSAMIEMIEMVGNMEEEEEEGEDGEENVFKGIDARTLYTYTRVHGTYICTSMIHEAFGGWGRKKVHVLYVDLMYVESGMGTNFTPLQLVLLTSWKESTYMYMYVHLHVHVAHFGHRSA